MTIPTLERPAVTVVGLAIHTRPMSTEIPALWPRFVARMDEIADGAEPRVSYGVMRDDGDSLYYLAGVSVRAAASVPPGMASMVIPAGSYASFSYPLSGLGKGFGEIFEKLLPASGFVQVPGQPLFERYDEKFDPGNPESAVQICIPVRRK